MIRFTDGMEFQTDGPLQAVRKPDGWYVIGRGMVVPVASHEEAMGVIGRQLKKEKDNED